MNGIRLCLHKILIKVFLSLFLFLTPSLYMNVIRTCLHKFFLKTKMLRHKSVHSIRHRNSKRQVIDLDTVINKRSDAKIKLKICEKTRSIRAKTIANMLLKQNVESNPGPESNIKPNVAIRTYNCNGLGNTNKFRRLLTKLRPEVQQGGIALLQETHIVDENLIKLYWKMNFVTSCVSTNRGG